MDETAFEELVEEAVASIPDVFLEMLDWVAIVVEDWPDRETMRLARVEVSHYQLLGFDQGIPKTGRNSGYNRAPYRISIYRRPIEAQCRSEQELREMVRRVVLHELAHHFGIDDSRLHEIGAVSRRLDSELGARHRAASLWDSQVGLPQRETAPRIGNRS